MPIVKGGGVVIPFDGESAGLIAESKKVIAELERVKKETKAANAEMAKAAKEAEKANSKTKFSWTEVASAIGLAKQGLEMAKKAYNFAREGAEIEFIQIKFDRLATSIGTTSDVLLTKMKEATGGTLSDMEAMGAATDLMSLGLAKTSDEAIRLATVQAGLAMDTNQLVLALSNQTTMRFDQLGLGVDGFKEKVDKLKESGMDANDAFKEAFLQQAEEQLEKLGSAADTNLGNFKRLEAQMKDNKDAAQLLAAEGMGPLVGWLANSTEAINTNREALKNINTELYKEYSAHKVLTPEMKKVIAEYTRAKEYGVAWGEALQAQINPAVEDGTLSIEEQEEALKNLSKANASLIQGAIDTTKANEDYQKSQDDVLKQIDELTAKKAAYYPWEVEKIQETQGQIDELSVKYEENAQAFIDAMEEKFALLAIEKIAMSDGVAGYSEAEYEKAKAILETTNTASAAAFEQQHAMELLTGAVADGQISVEDFGKIMDEVMADGVVSAEEVANALNNIPSDKTVRINVITTGGVLSGDKAGGNYPGYASGTKSAPGGMAWVGERGPELMDIPRGAQIYNNQQSMQMAQGGGGVTVNNYFNGVFSDPEKLAYQLGPAIKRVLRAEGVSP